MNLLPLCTMCTVCIVFFYSVHAHARMRAGARAHARNSWLRTLHTVHMLHIACKFMDLPENGYGAQQGAQSPISSYTPPV